MGQEALPSIPVDPWPVILTLLIPEEPTGALILGRSAGVAHGLWITVPTTITHEMDRIEKIAVRPSGFEWWPQDPMQEIVLTPNYPVEISWRQEGTIWVLEVERGVSLEDRIGAWIAGEQAHLPSG